jgi:uncharacterized protein (DUF1330 family)
MPAYMIFIRETAIRDPAEMQRYRTKNRDKPPQPMPVPLAVYGRIEALEGKAADGIVMLKFDSVDDARAWYHSAEYQDVVQHRKNAADYRVMIVEGL